MFAGLACGLQIRDSASAVGLVNKIRTTGVTSGILDDAENVQPVGAIGLGYPDYSTNALFRTWVASYAVPVANLWPVNGAPLIGELTPKLGGMSTGGDVCPEVDTNGVLSVGIGMDRKWYGLSFTLDSNSIPVPSSYIEGIVGAGNSAAGTIFTYTAEGSVGIASSYADEIRVEYTDGQLLRPATGFSAPEVSAFDWGMGYIIESPGGGATRIQPRRNSFYFTVTREWIQFVNTFDVSQPPIALANTVYHMQWDGTTWSLPVVAWSSDELFGPGADTTGAEIDAISVDIDFQAPSLPERVVFSVGAGDVVFDAQNNPVELDQIMVAQRGSTPVMPATSLKLAGQVEVSERMGLDDPGTAPPVSEPNVSGLCGRDPGDESFVFDPLLGIPVNEAATERPATEGIGLGLMRTLVGDGQNALLKYQVTGIDTNPLGIPVIQLQIAEFDITNPDLPVQTSPWSYGPLEPHTSVLPSGVFETATDRVYLSVLPEDPTGVMPSSEFRIRATVRQLDPAEWLNALLFPNSPQLWSLPGVDAETSLSVSLLK